jgi:hypothetical protein
VEKNPKARALRRRTARYYARFTRMGKIPFLTIKTNFAEITRLRFHQRSGQNRSRVLNRPAEAHKRRQNDTTLRHSSRHQIDERATSRNIHEQNQRLRSPKNGTTG